MSTTNGIEQWLPGKEQQLRQSDLIPHAVAMLGIAGFEVPHRAMEEFGFSDEWSVASREAVIDVGLRGGFDGKHVFEAGTGDNRLGGLAVMTAFNRAERNEGAEVSKLTTIDIDANKLPLAFSNMETNPSVAKLLGDEKVEMYSGDAVQLVDQWNTSGKRFDGVAIACLPQSNGRASENYGITGTQSDVITNDDWIVPYLAEWGSSALHLNAAFLDKMRAVSEPTAEIIMVLNERVPVELHAELFAKTGWNVKELLKRVVVNQDYDTDITWMEKAPIDDDGQRFLDVNNKPLSYAEAANIQRAGGVLRHGVRVYRLGVSEIATDQNGVK